jgi:GT2 family glycosyltransferase
MSAQAPRVSVVVPLYNKVATVERTLRSISAQTFTDFEVIVVDDGSTDGSAAIVEAFADGRFTLVRQANAGPGAARNRAIERARARLLAFLDADDEWLPDFLSRAIEELEATNVNVVTFAFYEGAERISSVPRFRARGLRQGVLRVAADTRPSELIALNVFINSWATVASKEIIRAHGGFVEEGCTYAEDATLWLRVALAEPVALVFEPLVYWHSEDSELSRNRRGARQIEPFLRDPEPLYATTATPLRELLDRFLATRAAKTACMLAFWGNWAAARDLVRRFCRVQFIGERFVAVAYVAATPFGAFAGRLVRHGSRYLPLPKSLGSASWDA